MWQGILLIIGAYFLGSVPHLVALGKMRGIRMDGDRHILLWNRGGRALGFVGVILDIAKGAIPVLAGKLLHFDIAFTSAAGVAVVTGQMWPVFNKFNGEKGNSIGVGMAVALAYKPFLIAAVVFAIGAGMKVLPRLWLRWQTLNEWSRFGGPASMSLPVGMIAGYLVLPIAAWGFQEPLAVTVGFAVLFILLIIRRITAGLRADLQGKRNTASIIINRVLLDRSYREYRDMGLT